MPLPESPAPRVLHLRSSCGLYGAEGVIYNLVRHYRGQTVTVCLADAREPHTELTDRLANEGCATETLPASGALDPTLPFRLGALLRRVCPDVVHTHEYKTDTLGAMTRALPLMGRRIPLVATMHGVVRTSGALRRYERMDARALRRFDAVVAVSAGTASMARAYGVPEDRIHIVPNGVDTDLFRPGHDRGAARERLGIPPDGALIGMAGRLSEEKGPLQLLEAFASLKHNPLRTRLVYVGDGPLEDELRKRAQSLGVAESVHLLGRRDDMPRVYAALDVLALPSLTEGLPLTILEASACGTPVVASDVGDVGRVLPNGLAARIVPPGDTRSLAEALTLLVAEPERRRTLAEEARRRVETSHSARVMADGYEEIYRRVAGHAPHSERATVEARR